MADPVKRLNYFDREFLQAGDFTAEQAYHVQMRRLHNSLCHAWGIASGLQASFKAGTSIASVSAGVAIDSAGRDLVLADDSTRIDLSSFKGQTVFLTITYQEQEGDPSSDLGATGNTRWIESVKVDVVAAPADPSLNVVLARLTIGADGSISAADDGVLPNVRRMTGVGGADVTSHSIAFTDASNPPNTWPKLNAGAAASTLETNAALACAGDVTLGGNLNAPKGGATINGTVLVNHVGGISQNMMFLSGDDQGGYALSFNAHRRPMVGLNALDFVDTGHSAVMVRMDDSLGYAALNVTTTTTAANDFWWTERLFVNGDTGDIRMAIYGGSVNVSGDVYARGVKLVSDARLKEDLCPIDDPLGRVADIRGVSYRHADHAANGMDLGVIAQEVEPVFPELVETSADGLKAVDYGRLGAVLVEALKELNGQVSRLENRISRVERTEKPED